MGCKLLAYYRVSRKRQEQSGLGLEAQRADVAAYVEKSGCEVIGSYEETETGKKHDLTNRPELRKAIAHAKRSKATLVVAKLDRLLRSTVVCTMLKQSGVPFVACDNPTANELTIDILAAVAANEVREISKRTKAALTALKARGVALGAARKGAPHLTKAAQEQGRALAAKSITARFEAAYTDILDDIRELRCDGSTLVEIAAELNRRGHTTRRGQPWNPMQVSRVLSLAEAR